MRKLKSCMGVALASIFLFCAGCTKYNWGSYESGMLSHFKNPDLEQLDGSFSRSADSAEQCKKVPPGLFAEAGFVKYERGEYSAAIEYFQKEKELWPESAFFMDKMIRNAQNGGGSQL